MNFLKKIIFEHLKFFIHYIEYRPKRRGYVENKTRLVSDLARVQIACENQRVIRHSGGGRRIREWRPEPGEYNSVSGTKASWPNGYRCRVALRHTRSYAGVGALAVAAAAARAGPNGTRALPVVYRSRRWPAHRRRQPASHVRQPFALSCKHRVRHVVVSQVEGGRCLSRRCRRRHRRYR